MENDRTIYTFLVDTMNRVEKDMNNGTMRFSSIEERFTDVDGRECGIWDQDVTLFALLTTLIPDPTFLDVSINN